MQSLTIIGTRWQDSNGNTYHRARVLIDGITWATSDIKYGYGRHYERTATHMLYEHVEGLAPSDALYRWALKNGVGYESIAIDVGRKKDL